MKPLRYPFYLQERGPKRAITALRRCCLRCSFRRRSNCVRQQNRLRLFFMSSRRLCENLPNWSMEPPDPQLVMHGSVPGPTRSGTLSKIRTAALQIKGGTCSFIGGTSHAISGSCAALQIKSGTSAIPRLQGVKSCNTTDLSASWVVQKDWIMSLCTIHSQHGNAFQ
jgi:hypothetical protein